METARTDDDLEALRRNPSRSRAIELKALLFAVRPLASDLAATLAFYAVLALSGNVAAAVVFGIALGVVQLVWMLSRRQPISAMQWTSLALVVVMGGLTLVTDDPRYVLFKVSIVYLAIGAAMLQPGWIYRYVPPIAIGHIPRRLVIISGFVWAALIIGTGLLNLALVLTQTPRMVAIVMGLWAPTSKIALFAGQYLVFRAVARRSIRAHLVNTAGRDEAEFSTPA